MGERCGLFFLVRINEKEGWLLNARSPRSGKVTSDFLLWLHWSLSGRLQEMEILNRIHDRKKSMYLHRHNLPAS